jgi:hypothetical protein
MKTLLLLVIALILIQPVYPQTSPDYIFGDNYGSGWGWTTGTLGTAGLGNSYKWTFQANASNNLYFKLGETSSSTDGGGFWMNNAAPDLQYTGSGAVWNAYYYGNMGTNGAIYFTVTNTKYYVVKSRKDPSNSNANFSVQELSAAPVTITAVTDNFKSAGTSMDVFITLSGSKSTEEKIFVRYTTDNWSTSSITSAATGSGTSYTATIPAGGVTGTSDNKYYVFTTTLSSPSTSEADLVAINYYDNTGNFNNISTKSITFQIISWQSRGFGPVMWSQKRSNPDEKSCAGYPCGDTAWATTRAYTTMEYNTIGGSNGLACDCSPFTGNGLATTSSATAEETNLLNGTGGITIYFGSGGLAGFNSRCPDGDRRIYTGSDVRVKLNGVDKLVFDSYRLDIDVVYATNSITSTGWAKINVAGSDPLWVKEFDPYGTGQVIFEASSSSAVVQNCYGGYNVVLKMKSSEINSVQSSSTVAVQGQGINETVNLTNSDVSYNFTNASFGGEEGTANGVFANQVFSAPGGAPPSGIDAISNQYWDLSTALDTFTCSITFDLSEISGISNTANLRILRRTNSGGAWSTWGDYTLVDGTHIKANGVTALSEWTIGSTGGNPLPVELTSFTGMVENGFVVLKWNTATEIGSYGFEIERREKNCNCSWQTLGFVLGNGNSNTPKDYFYKDDINSPGGYCYRLKMIDTDSKFDYSNEISISLEQPIRYELFQNYPNPFNPVTSIKYDIKDRGLVTLKVYDVLGDEVVTLINEEKEPGFYSVEFNGSSLSSGVYFYRMIALDNNGNPNIRLLKMVLIK